MLPLYGNQYRVDHVFSPASLGFKTSKSGWKHMGHPVFNFLLTMAYFYLKRTFDLRILSFKWYFLRNWKNFRLMQVQWDFFAVNLEGLSESRGEVRLFFIVISTRWYVCLEVYILWSHWLRGFWLCQAHFFVNCKKSLKLESKV